MTSYVVVVGGSLGGFRAMATIARALPASFPLPIVLVLHRDPDSDGTLESLLQDRCSLQVVSVRDKDVILPGQVHVAPPGYHLLVEADHVSLSADDPVRYSRPSIDAMFESAVDSYGDRVIGVVLSGANDDGARGAALIDSSGGLVIVQDPTTADAATMPLAAVKAARGALVMTPEEIGPYLSVRATVGRPS